MSVASLKTASPPEERAGLVPLHFNAELIVTPEGNPSYTPAMLADLVASIREHGQLVPGWVCPSPDLPDNKRICLEGNRRREACLLLGLPFWAFDLGRVVPEAERIKLTFQHNHSRRVMSREEIAERASRFMEITGSTAFEAARLLNISPPTLSRAFGELRIPPELKPRAELLGPSIRSLIAALPVPLMEQAIQFAETPGPDGKKPTRDLVAANNRLLKKTGKPKGRKPKAITLRVEGRTVTASVTASDTATSVSKDLNIILAKLAKLGDVPPEGWHFHFK